MSYDTLLGELERIYAPLNDALMAAYWNLSTTGSNEAAGEVQKAGQARLAFLSQPALFKEVSRAYASATELAPLARRSLLLWRNTMWPYQADQALSREILDEEIAVEQLFGSFQPAVAGQRCSRNDLEETLRTSLDTALLEEAWRAAYRIGSAAAPRVRRLVALRNRLAQSLRFPNFYAFSLSLQEIDPERLQALMRELAALTEPLFLREKAQFDRQLRQRFGLSADAPLYPWHYMDRFFQLAPALDPVLQETYDGKDPLPLAEAFYQSLGLDIAPILAHSDLYERPGKDPHAFCTSLNRQGDVRILVNLRANARWAGTLLHELGHAVYERNLDPELPYILKDPHLANHESISLLMEQHQIDPLFLAQVVGVADPGLVQRMARCVALDHLTFVRFALVMVDFERTLYQNPAGDLGERWWRHVAALQHLTPPPGPRSEDFAVKDHIARSPVYYHNYLLGHLGAAQLLSSLEKVSGRPFIYGSRDAGAVLVERWFRPGASLPWDKLVRHATTQEVRVQPFAARLERHLS